MFFPEIIVEFLEIHLRRDHGNYQEYNECVEDSHFRTTRRRESQMTMKKASAATTN